MWYDANETTVHKRPNDTEINNYRSSCLLVNEYISKYFE